MPDITWEVVDVSQRRRKVGAPCATIGHGRIALNADACEFINADQYEWAEVLKGFTGRKLENIGVRFLKEKTKTSFKLAKRKSNNVIKPGVNINSKKLIKELFGESGATKTRRYDVTQDKDDKTMLIIDLNNEMI